MTNSNKQQPINQQQTTKQAANKQSNKQPTANNEHPHTDLLTTAPARSRRVPWRPISCRRLRKASFCCCCCSSFCCCSSSSPPSCGCWWWRSDCNTTTTTTTTTATSPVVAGVLVFGIFLALVVCTCPRGIVSLLLSVFC